MEMVGEMVMVDVGLNDQVRVWLGASLPGGRGLKGAPRCLPPSVHDASAVGSQGAGPTWVPAPPPVLGHSPRTLKAMAVSTEAASRKRRRHSLCGSLCLVNDEVRSLLPQRVTVTAALVAR